MKLNLNNCAYFINRELSWLEFNERVLYQADEKNNKLLERLKFLSIVSSNLEEFFMVRVAAINQQKEDGLKVNTPDGLSFDEQLKLIRERVKKMLLRQYDIFYNKLIPALQKNNIQIITKLKDMQKYEKYLFNIFENEIKPILTPISIGATHPFPNLLTGRLYLAVGLAADPDCPEILKKGNLSFIEIPTNIQGRFIKIEKEQVYIPIEKIVKLFADNIYSGFKVKSKNIIKITRDADFEIDKDDVADLLKEVEFNIKRMHQRDVIKLEYEKGLPIKILNTIIAKNQFKKKETFEIQGILNLNDLMELYNKIDNKELKDAPLTPVIPMDFYGDNIFDEIKKNDFLFFHPYQSYQPVVDLINEAADDPKVLAIKQLLYRTSSASPIINALIKAAENGKYVTVIVEVTARFDEKRNIEWTKKLQNAGAHVIYGIADLKTHAKALLIVRKENNVITKYIHLATGNYNEITAKLYTDLSFFTCEGVYGEDISVLFNLLTGFSMPDNFNRVSVAPLDLRGKFLFLIEREMQNAKKGIKAKIIAKMNSLNDAEIVRALYNASNAGVKIELIVRGICILRPNLKKISQNIKVKSIVGQFLEHARIFYFYNGGDEEYYLSSADWMSRNLDKRIELLFPIKNEENKKYIANILKIQWTDEQNSWYLEANGSYKKHIKKQSGNAKNYFKEIYDFIKKSEKKNKKPALNIFNAKKTQLNDFI